MNKFALLVLFCFFYQLSFGQNEIIDNHNLLTLNLKGKVKTVKSDSNYQYFDTLGNLVLAKTYTDSGSIINYSLKYDSKSRIAEIYDLEMAEKNIFKFDSLNRVVSSTSYRINHKTRVVEEVLMQYDYTYNLYNLLIKKERHKGKIKYFTEFFKYDSLNRLITQESNNGRLLDSYNFEYDNENNLIKMEWLDADGSVIEVKTYTYDNGLLLAMQWLFYEEGMVGAYIEEKFEKGLIKEEIEVYLRSEEQIKYCFSYEFDNQGNWIKKMTRDDEGEIKSYGREIEYY